MAEMQHSPRPEGVERRYEFIEWRCYWTGRLNRKDLEDRFKISTPQASNDLKAYQEAWPGNIAYDATGKAYHATIDFYPRYMNLSPERFLLQLQAVQSGAVDKADTWFDRLPAVDVTPPIVRTPQAYALRAIIKAIETRSAIPVYYQSLTHAAMRTICPHSLAFDGFRWHVRALSLEREEFRDYVLGRILSYSVATGCAADPADDIEWNNVFVLRIVAHPGLSDQQRAAIERDYRMQDGILEVPVRLALGFYFIKRHNLDLVDLPPERAQLKLENFREFNEARDAAKAESLKRVAAKGLRRSSGLGRT